MFVMSVLLLKAILCVDFLVPRISNTNALCRLNGELTLDLSVHVLSSRELTLDLSIHVLSSML
jgi:hypothetical protein